jgi:hypothetical protein
MTQAPANRYKRRLPMRYLCILLLLSGCETQEQRASELIAAYGPYCEKLGYTKDTDAWRQCIQFEDAAFYSRVPPFPRARRF